MSTTTCPNCNAALSITVANQQPSPEPKPLPLPLPSGMVDIGSATPDGSRHVARWAGDVIAVLSIRVPHGLPTSRSSISVFEYGGPIFRCETWLSKTRGDLSATGPYHTRPSSGANLYFTIDGTTDAIIGAGETWYLHIKSYAAQTAAGIKIYPPN